MLIPAHLFLIPGLLFLAALFAAAEASLFSLSRSQLESLRTSTPHAFHLIHKLIDRPERLLSSIIIGNEFLNITIGTLVVASLEFMGRGMDPKLLALLSVGLSSILLLTFAEVLPKVIAVRFPVVIASLLAYPMFLAYSVLEPMGRLFLGVSGFLLRIAGIETIQKEAVNENDILTLVEAGEESGSLESRERQMIVNVFHFTDRPISSVMTPWEKVFWLPDTLDVKGAIEKILEHPLSRIPVVARGGAEVVGILYTKELLSQILNKEEDKRSIRAFTAPPFVVSAQKKVAKLFREFKQRKIHFALVVDEYGRQIGVVTLEDLLNALFHTQAKKEA